MVSRKNPFSFKFKLAMSAIVLIGVAAAALAINVSGWPGRRVPAQSVAALESGTAGQISQPAVRQGLLNAKLSLQPEANRLRRRLGNRFLTQ
ncbi:MAG: hypothetical protein AAB401_01450, partial [Acidobacteriota bacterium]